MQNSFPVHRIWFAMEIKITVGSEEYSVDIFEILFLAQYIIE